MLMMTVVMQYKYYDHETGIRGMLIIDKIEIQDEITINRGMIRECTFYLGFLHYKFEYDRGIFHR